MKSYELKTQGELIWLERDGDAKATAELDRRRAVMTLRKPLQQLLNDDAKAKLDASKTLDGRGEL